MASIEGGEEEIMAGPPLEGGWPNCTTSRGFYLIRNERKHYPKLIPEKPLLFVLIGSLFRRKPHARLLKTTIIQQY